MSFDIDRSQTKSRRKKSEYRKVDGFKIAEKMDLIEEAEKMRFLKSVWKKVDADIEYPEDLSTQRITGDVTVQLELDKKGIPTGKHFSIQATDPVLKAYVLAVLLQSLSNPIEDKFWGESSQVVVFRFEFDVFVRGGGPRPESVSQPQFKNILSFERYSEVPPIMNEVIDKVLTRYVPPIIPIPGGVFIDFIRLYQFIANLDEPDPDDLRRVRIELEKSAWTRKGEEALNPLVEPQRTR